MSVTVKAWECCECTRVNTTSTRCWHCGAMAPSITSAEPSVYDLVSDDLRARKSLVQLGAGRGQPARDALVDAYASALDLVVNLKTVIVERGK